MTKQQAFNKVWQHFVVEKNPPSINKKGDCLYRGPNGEKCAAGLFIPDDKYRRSMECRPAECVADAMGVDTETAKFIRHLQACHDDASVHLRFTAEMERRLKSVAARFNLTIPCSTISNAQA